MKVHAGIFNVAPRPLSAQIVDLPAETRLTVSLRPQSSLDATPAPDGSTPWPSGANAATADSVRAPAGAAPFGARAAQWPSDVWATFDGWSRDDVWRDPEATYAALRVDRAGEDLHDVPDFSRGGGNRFSRGMG